MYARVKGSKSNKDEWKTDEKRKESGRNKTGKRESERTRWEKIQNKTAMKIMKQLQASK